MPRKKEIKTELEKRRLLDEAVRQIMFETHSFEAVTIKRICEIAGVSSGVFYYYYKNKDEAVIHQLHFMSEQYEGYLERYKDKNAEELLHEYYHIYCTEMMAYGKSVTHGFMQALYNDGRYLNNLDSISHVILLRQIIERGCEDGEFSGCNAPGELAGYYFITMRGLVYHWACADDEFDLLHSVNIMVSSLVVKLKKS